MEKLTEAAWAKRMYIALFSTFLALLTSPAANIYFKKFVHGQYWNGTDAYKPFYITYTVVLCALTLNGLICTVLTSDSMYKRILAGVLYLVIVGGIQVAGWMVLTGVLFGWATG